MADKTPRVTERGVHDAFSMSMSGIIAKDVSQDCEEEKRIVQELKPATKNAKYLQVQSNEDIDTQLIALQRACNAIFTTARNLEWKVDQSKQALIKYKDLTAMMQSRHQKLLNRIQASNSQGMKKRDIVSDDKFNGDAQ